LPLHLRAVAAELAASVGWPRVLLALRRRGRPKWLTVVNYHRVSEVAAAADVDEGVLDATPGSFDRQLRVLKDNYSPITLGDLLAHLGGAELPPNPALVTFDDGYRDNHDHALPILLRHGIRATFFIATDYVDERRLYWWDRISWIVKHAERQQFVLEYPQRVEIDLRSAGVERRLHRIPKSSLGLDLERFLRELADASSAPWDARREARLVDRLVMTWDHVRALRRAGMDVGSHTRSHRVLHALAPSELEGELAGSRACLEAVLGEPVRAIAYPVGRSIAKDPVIVRAFQSAGYGLGFSYGTGLQPLDALVAYDVRRVPVERTSSDARFLVRLTTPWLELRPADREPADRPGGVSGFF
jgi:peptidoglycan/xylan/chitin deacetylase (PgdA/CDA1 family)